MNDFYRHKKSDKIKWVLTGIAFVLVFVFLAGLCMQLFGNDKIKPANWFKKPDTEQTTPATPDENGGLAVSDGVSNGVKLTRSKIAPASYADYGIDTQSESAYSLTATITPASADDKRVEWTIAPKSGSTNASDYITLNANGLSATVSCKQAFDVQFIVTVASLDNPNAKATCTLDYVEKVTGVTVNMPSLTSNVAAATYTVQSSKYTIKADTSVVFSNFRINNLFADIFYGEFDNVSGGCYAEVLDPPAVSYTSKGVEFARWVWDGNGDRLAVPDGLAGCFVVSTERDLDDYVCDTGDLIYAFRLAVAQAYIGTIDITVSSSYGGTVYSSVSKSVELWIDGAALHVSVGAVSLSDSSFVF